MISNRVVGIIGPKGSGKTYFSARMFGQENRALVYQVVRSNDEYDIYATHVADGDIIGVGRTIHKQDKFRVVYKVPDADFIVSRSRRLVYMSAPVLARECYEEGNMTIYFDEAHLYMDQMFVDPALLRIIFLARNQSLNIVWVAQSLEVHRSIRRNTDVFVFFRITEPGDLDKIIERCGDEVAHKVSNLEALHKESGKIIPGQTLVWKASEA
jgi:hypothetical protein